MAFVNTWEERGIEKGIAQGFEKGIEKGITLGEAALLERLLTRRFGPLSDDVRSHLRSATPDQLQTWGDRVLDAATLGEVFGGH